MPISQSWRQRPDVTTFSSAERKALRGGFSNRRSLIAVLRGSLRSSLRTTLLNGADAGVPWCVNSPPCGRVNGFVRNRRAEMHGGFSDWQTRLPVRKMVRHDQEIIRGNHGAMDLASLRRSCDLCKTNLMVA